MHASSLDSLRRGSCVTLPIALLVMVYALTTRLRAQDSDTETIPVALMTFNGFGGSAGLTSLQIGAQLHVLSVGLTAAYKSLIMEGQGYGLPPPGSTAVGIEQAGELGFYLAPSVLLYGRVLLIAGPDFTWTRQRMKWTHGQADTPIYTDEAADFRLHWFTSALIGPIEEELWIGAGYGSHRSLFFSFLFTFE